MEQYQLTIHSHLYAGKGSVENLKTIIANENAQDILLFTDHGIRGLGLTKEVEAIAGSMAASFRVIEDLTAEPAVADIERVLAEIGGKPDLILAVGGGSVMDAAKIASITAGAEYGLPELMKDSSIAKKCVKTVMMPTTCGTGSEATCNAIVAIPEQESKQGIVNNCMIPDYVILDVNMIAKLPKKIIAATGVDALAHCVECFT